MEEVQKEESNQIDLKNIVLKIEINWWVGKKRDEN